MKIIKNLPSHIFSLRSYSSLVHFHSHSIRTFYSKNQPFLQTFSKNFQLNLLYLHILQPHLDFMLSDHESGTKKKFDLGKNDKKCE